MPVSYTHLDVYKRQVLGLYGAEDASIPPDQVEAMKEKLEAAGKTAKFKIYPGAGHGFFADYRQSYRADVAQDAWIDVYKRQTVRLVSDVD